VVCRAQPDELSSGMVLAAMPTAPSYIQACFCGIRVSRPGILPLLARIRGDTEFRNAQSNNMHDRQTQDSARSVLDLSIGSAYFYAD
jgi:hypothetical protein